MKRSGFTLIEMLVVIGIIAVLAGATFVGVGTVTRKAQRAKAQEVVSNTATALSFILQERKVWPKILMNNSGQQLDKDVARVFITFKLMGLAYREETDSSTDKKVYVLKGADRCGIVDPWAASVLKANISASESTRVPSGKTVKDHILWYAIDKDGDGIVTKGEGAPVDVRANAVVWGAGADGDMETSYGKRTKKSMDDIYSWSRSQEVR